ncbi:class I SAM-dependent methyltransferase [Chitinophaga sp. SYP-B3965]|uniref:class I SAM-dependent methyltransferase n=1 Tax=Chitinophaga sp. SYP-B3965 TaxID=2663120 RepID=UPI00156709B2
MKAIAEQLRKPVGDLGKQVGARMNEGSLYINQYTIAALQIKSHQNILEIGMGNGFFVKDVLAAAPSVKYTGCDFSETMVAEARSMNMRFIQKRQAEFIVAASDELPLFDALFDTVFTVNTLYFWHHPEKELAEIRRVLKPGGKLFIAIRPASVMQALPFVQYGFRLYEKQDVEVLLKQNKFSGIHFIEKTEPHNMATLIVCAAKI